MRHRLPYSSEEGSDGAIDMTPMLDIVFIMLIFFIVTTTFVKETGVDINRPQAQTASTQNEQSILVAITENNEIWINQHQVDPRAVRRNVERMRAEVPNGGVIIQADKHSQTGLLVTVMDQIKLAGVENIAISASSNLGGQ